MTDVADLVTWRGSMQGMSGGLVEDVVHSLQGNWTVEVILVGADTDVEDSHW